MKKRILEICGMTLSKGIVVLCIAIVIAGVATANVAGWLACCFTVMILLNLDSRVNKTAKYLNEVKKEA